MCRESMVLCGWNKRTLLRHHMNKQKRMSKYVQNGWLVSLPGSLHMKIKIKTKKKNEKSTVWHHYFGHRKCTDLYEMQTTQHLLIQNDCAVHKWKGFFYK